MKNITLQFLLIFILIVSVSLPSSGQDTQIVAANYTKSSEIKSSTTDPIVTAGEQKEAEAKKEEEEGKLSVNGYLDSYYFTNFNSPSSRDNMGQSGVGRGFDRRVDMFQLGMVQTVFKYTNKKSEMVADLAFGPSAQYGNYGNVPVMAPAYGMKLGNDVYSAIMIKQAYFKYNATDKLSFIMGQFGTHIGYEYIDAPLNFHYSINHTFNSGIPFYHTGIKATYAFSDKVSLMGGIVNGFDYVHDNNRAKGIISQLALTPAKGLGIYLNYINTNESNADALGNTPDGNFTVYDLNGGYQLTPKFYVGWWFMYGSQYGQLESPGTFIPADGDITSTKTWYGANLYLQYALSDVFTVGFRGEHFDNSSGARGLRNVDGTGQAIGATANTYTLTGSLNLADNHLILKPELRMDVFNSLDGVANEKSQQFMDSKGEYSKNSQTTLGFAAIYKF
ncbi:MAG TPA: outer membrane beta-barrel protein [Cyclobacteriaceae bacterium]|nr:outer membrane beta-barrel protein [Cyclobacteriaceae bacterium]